MTCHHALGLQSHLKRLGYITSDVLDGTRIKLDAGDEFGSHYTRRYQAIQLC